MISDDILLGLAIYLVTALTTFTVSVVLLWPDIVRAWRATCRSRRQ